MKTMKFRKLMALLLALAMFASIVPMSVFATDAADTDEAVTETTETVTTDETVVTEETETPVEETEAPVEETEAPMEETEAPVEETEAPVEETEAPVEETEAPVEETEAPVEETEAAEELPEVIDVDESVEVFVSDLNAIADSDEEPGVKVSVTSTQIVIDITQVGTNGTAQLYRTDANRYVADDKITGLSDMTGVDGVYLCDYTLGTTQRVTFNRYHHDGSDYLYAKYYLVQKGKVVAGPFYASEIASLRTKAPFEVNTKKGLALEDGSTITVAKEMGCSNTVINMDLCDFIIAKEDADGNPVDLSKRTDIIEFESNGETFYFDADTVAAQDALIVPYSKAGMNVTLIVIAWAKTCDKSYPQSLQYLEKASMNRQTMGFNTSNERGMKYFIAAMEFLAERYSKSANSGLVNKFVISNEIDYTYDWNLIMPLQDENGNYQRADFDVFMEEYARAFRLANLAVKKYNSENKVMVSLTHNWAINCYESYKYTSAIRYNSYAPKDILDWLCKVEGARGNYDWGIAQHPYAIGTTSSNPTLNDAQGYASAKPITNDFNTSPWVTVSNLELLQQYLEQGYARCNGELRTVSLTEATVCHAYSSSMTQEQYQQVMNEQAASIAQMYYRAAHLSCIGEVVYFQLHDRPTLRLGLREEDGTNKPAYNVWKYVDTNKTFNFTNRYLKNIESGITSYKDVMSVKYLNSNEAAASVAYWEKRWNPDLIMTRILSTEGTDRSLKTDKATYGADDPILVTATGDDGDTIGLYKAGDNLEGAPIYSYPVRGSIGPVKFYSGTSYDIITYGEISPSRAKDAKLTAGAYKIVLTRGDTGETMSLDITLSANYNFGSTAHSIKTDKTTYYGGENIIVSATGNSNCWVGLYAKDDVYGKGHVTSIYWYYVNDPENGRISGRPTILQTTTHNTSSSNPGTRIKAGDYIVYLFDGTGGDEYNMVDSVEISVIPAEVPALTSVNYQLNDSTSGLANGLLTVNKAADNQLATDCVMYWGDANGNHLEGYGPLAMFKLEGNTTVRQMVSYTFIPEGAVKLLAYASDGDSLSKTAVSVDLPADCQYKMDGKVLAEFQIGSDIHIPTKDNPNDETKLSVTHLTQLMQDIKKNSPESLGIFLAGDISNSGSESEYMKVFNIYQTEKNKGDGRLPELHISIGNHDWMKTNPNGLFQKYAKIFNSNLPETPENVYYHEELGGYHFVYLGGEQPGLRALLSAEQLDWFDNLMAEITAKDPNKPVFVFLHQSFYNTVSGSLPGEGWDGVARENSLKKIIKKYGQILLFNGHSHWLMDSESNMFAGDDVLPVAFNTASVSYLWSGYNILSGEHADGSHCYYVRVYEDKVVIQGRDIENGLYLPSASYVVRRNVINTESDVYNTTVGGELINFNATTKVPALITYLSTNTNIASVTEDGTVIAKREGEVDVVITAAATDSTVTTRKTVKIKVGDAAVYRIFGDNRFETANKVASATLGNLNMDKYDAVVVACGTDFADALSSSYLAYQMDAPILLAYGSNQKYADMVKDYIRANVNEGGTVYLLGGTKVMPDMVANGLLGYTVERLAGENRYETNMQILRKAGVTGGEIIICSGRNYADALSASAVKKPVMLVHKKLTDSQKAYLASLSNCKFYICGGENAVSKTVETELAAYGSIERIGGANRCETSVMIAERFFSKPDSAVLAYAKKFPDGLCGGPLAMSEDAPVILTCKGFEGVAKAYLQKNGINTGYVLGGNKLLSDDLTRTVFGLDANTAVTIW